MSWQVQWKLFHSRKQIPPFSAVLSDSVTRAVVTFGTIRTPASLGSENSRLQSRITDRIQTRITAHVQRNRCRAVSGESLPLQPTHRAGLDFGNAGPKTHAKNLRSGVPPFPFPADKGRVNSRLRLAFDRNHRHRIVRRLFRQASQA